MHGALEQGRILHAYRAEHDAAYARFQPFAHSRIRTQSAARLNNRAERGDLFEQCVETARFAERARKIDDVQRLRAAVEKGFRPIERIAVIGDPFAFAVEQAHRAPL